MKTLNYFLHFARAALVKIFFWIGHPVLSLKFILNRSKIQKNIFTSAALAKGRMILAAGIVVTPFGPIQDRLKEINPWRGSDLKGPILLIVRAQNLESSGKKTCEKMVQALKNTEGDRSISAWEPWAEKDLAAVTKCNSFPCKVKLNETEVRNIASMDLSERVSKFRELVQSRLKGYQKNEERKEYEFPGDPVDPWDFFEKIGLVSKLKKSQTPTFIYRKINFDTDDLLPIRQVLDRRISHSKGREGVVATVWIRDVYTDHYFDGWGEWIQLSCQPQHSQGTLIHALLLEIDELKKTDVFSKLVQGKIVTATREQGTRYLDDFFKDLQSVTH